MARQRTLTRAIAIVAVLVASAAIALVIVTREPGAATVRTAVATTTTTAIPTTTASASSASSSSSSPIESTTVSTDEPRTTVPVVSEETTTVPTTTTSAAVPLQPDALLVVSAESAVDAINLDGSGRRTVVPERVWTADWSPDHQRVAWEEPGLGRAGRTIHVRDLESGADRVLVRGPDAATRTRPYYGLSWSPDGRSLLYVCLEGENVDGDALCTVDVTTGAVTDLVTTYRLIGPDDVDPSGQRVHITMGDWDPTSQLLTYELQAEQWGRKAFVLDLISGDHWQVPFDAGFPAVFTADGQWLLSLTDTGRGWQTILVPVHGGAVRAVPGIAGMAYGRSPDGQWYLSDGLAFTLDGRTRSLPVSRGVW